MAVTLGSNCARCGNKNSPEAKFCAKCGQALQPLDPHLEPPSESIQNLPRRIPWKLLSIAVVLVVLIVAAVAFVLNSGPRPGSESPEEAVTAFSAALSAENTVEALTLIAPEEVGSLINVYRRAARKAPELGLTQAGSRPMAGVDIKLSGLKLKTELFSEDVARVSLLDGKFAYSLADDRLGSRTKRAVEKAGQRYGFERSDSRTLAQIEEEVGQDAPLGIYLMTVRRDGRWYISVHYTVAEYFRQSLDLPAASFDAPSNSKGDSAPSPVEAVQELLDDAASLNFDALISHASASDLPVAWAYKSALVAEIRDMLIDDIGLSSVILTRPDLSAEMMGSAKAKVYIDQVTIEGEYDKSILDASDEPVTVERPFEATLNGTCLSVTQDGDSSTDCFKDSLEAKDLEDIDPGRVFVVVLKGDSG